MHQRRARTSTSVLVSSSSRGSLWSEAKTSSRPSPNPKPPRRTCLSCNTASDPQSTARSQSLIQINRNHAVLRCVSLGWTPSSIGSATLHRLPGEQGCGFGEVHMDVKDENEVWSARSFSCLLLTHLGYLDSEAHTPPT